VDIVVICGPAGSGKSTHVREEAKPGDLIVDVDLIYAALSGLELFHKPPGLLPFFCAARDAIVNRF